MFNIFKSFFSIKVAEAQSQVYQPLAPIEGFVEGDKFPDIVSYINNMITVIIAITVILAVIMIIYGGVQYMTTDSISGKGEGRARIQAAIGGLILALASWLILRTIDINITQVGLNIRNVGIPKEDYGDGYDLNTVANDPLHVGGGSIAPGSGTMVALDGSVINIKPGIAGNQVDSDLANKLYRFNVAMQGYGIDWRVTEAWPPAGYSTADPTGIHQSSCHGNGTCVDANFTGNSPATALNIKRFQDAASAANLRAVYEVKTEARRQELQAQGATYNIKVIPQITAEHFSVYNVD